MIAAGTVGLVRTAGFFGRVIRRAQEGQWNHIVVARGDGFCFSAEPTGGLQVRPETQWADVAWLTHEPLTDGQRAQRVEFLTGKLGTPYNVPAIFTFSRWFVPVPRGFLEWANDRPNMICSESAVLAARASASDWFPADRLACTVAPADIDVLFRRKGW